MSDNGKGTGEVSKLVASMNWPTVVLILLTGGGNLLLTERGNQFNTENIDRAIRQVRDLHDYLDDSIKRQKAAVDGVRQSLENQTTMLNNQTKMLKQLNDIQRDRNIPQSQ